MGNDSVVDVHKWGDQMKKIKWIEWVIILFIITIINLMGYWTAQEIKMKNSQIEYHLQKYTELQQRMDALEIRRDALEKTMGEYMKSIDRKISKEKEEGGVK
jgi:hypothetical protein